MTTASFTMPAWGSTVSVTVDSTAWMVAKMVLVLGSGSTWNYMKVSSVTDGTHVVLTNYTAGVNSGTIAAGAILKLISAPEATNTAPGLVPPPPNDSTQVLRGDGTFANLLYSSLASIPSNFTPSPHAATHASGASDPVTLITAQISDAPVSAAGLASEAITIKYAPPAEPAVATSAQLVLDNLASGNNPPCFGLNYRAAGGSAQALTFYLDSSGLHAIDKSGDDNLWMDTSGLLQWNAVANIPLPVQSIQVLGPFIRTSASFTVPTSGSSVSFSFFNAPPWPMTAGQMLLIQDGTHWMFGEVTVWSSSNLTVTVLNRGFQGSSTSGTMAFGAFVALVGPSVATPTLTT